MAQIEKLLVKLQSRPTDFTWEELKKVLSHFGYKKLIAGKTAGSRRKFVDETKHIISLHEPHPGNILKHYQIKDVIDALKERGNLPDE